MPFCGPGETYKYATLRWGSFICTCIWLLYYGYSKIKDVASREFFIQTTIKYLTPEERFFYFPDILICTTEGVVAAFDNPLNINITTLEIPFKDRLEHSVCYEKQDTMTIASAKHANAASYNFEWLVLSLEPKNVPSPGNFSDAPPANFYLLPSEHSIMSDESLEAAGLSKADGSARSLDEQSYLVDQTGSTVQIHAAVTTTKVLRKDIWGLFGDHESEPLYRVVSSLNSIDFYNGTSEIIVHIPYQAVVESQILVTSIPDAFASWGGAFGLSWSIFRLFFGSRYNPFGFLKRFRHRNTRRHLTRVYGYWSSHPQPNELEIMQPPGNSTESQLNVETPKSTSSSADKEYVTGRSKHYDECLRSHGEQIRKVAGDFDKLERLLRDHYLDMDLARADDPPPPANQP